MDRTIIEIILPYIATKIDTDFKIIAEDIGLILKDVTRVLIRTTDMETEKDIQTITSDERLFIKKS